MRITYPMISLLFENSRVYCPAELRENRKDHHKLIPGPCHLPALWPWEEKSPYCSLHKGEGSSRFRRSAMNGAALEGLGQVLGSPFKAGSSGGSHLQNNGLAQPPRQGYLSQDIQGVWMEIPQPLLASSPPTPSER